MESDRGEPGWQPAADLPPSPPLPPGPFSHEVVVSRLQQSLKELGTGRRSIEQAEAEGCSVVGIVDEVTAGLLSDEAFTMLSPFLVMAWEVFVPRGTRGPRIEAGVLRRRIRRDLQAAMESLKTGRMEAFARRLEGGSQPALTSMLMTLILAAGERLPKKERLDPNMTVIMIAVLRAVIEELDAACRQR